MKIYIQRKDGKQLETVDEFETRKEAKALEIKLHKKFDVRNHPKFINLANQTSIGFMTTPEIIEKGFGFIGLFPYFRWVLAIPCPINLGMWMQKHLWRKTKYDREQLKKKQ